MFASITRKACTTTFVDGCLVLCAMSYLVRSVVYIGFWVISSLGICHVHRGEVRRLDRCILDGTTRNTRLTRTGLIFRKENSKLGPDVYILLSFLTFVHRLSVVALEELVNSQILGIILTVPIPGEMPDDRQL